MVFIHDMDTDQPYLLLRDPFVRYRLTLLSKDDLPAMTSILSDTTIAQYLLNVPEPYTEQDALNWYNMQPTNHDLQYLSTKSEEKQKCVLSGRFPFSVIRDMGSNGGKLVGYFSIRRNHWEWMAAIDPAGRAKLRKDNEAKEAGDESISYSIGYYLSPQVASKGLMTEVISTALSYAKQYMNARNIQGICRHDNTASRRVMEKNGFKFVRQVEMPDKHGEMELELIFEKVLN